MVGFLLTIEFLIEIKNKLIVNKSAKDAKKISIKFQAYLPEVWLACRGMASNSKSVVISVACIRVISVPLGVKIKDKRKKTKGKR